MNRLFTFQHLIIVLAVLNSCMSARSQELTSEAIQDAARTVMGGDTFADVRRRALQGTTRVADGQRHGFLMRTLDSMTRKIGDFLSSLFGGRGARRPIARRTASNRSPRPSSPSASPTSEGSGGFSLNGGQIILYLGIFLALLIMMWIIASVIQSRTVGHNLISGPLSEGEGEAVVLSSPPGEVPVLTYESRAIQYAEQGDYAGAVRELLVGSMSWIERSGLIRFRKGLTNRDYMRAIWQQESRRDAFRSTAIHFERIFFGRRNATRMIFDECLKQFQESFREATATTAS